MRKVLLLALLLAPGCVTRSEFQKDVKAWRSFYDAVKDDLATAYDQFPEPVRRNRLGLLKDEERAIQAAEIRAGLRAEDQETNLK